MRLGYLNKKMIWIVYIFGLIKAYVISSIYYARNLHLVVAIAFDLIQAYVISLKSQSTFKMQQLMPFNTIENQFVQ